MSAPFQNSQTQPQNPFNISTPSQPNGFQPQPQLGFGSFQFQPQPQPLFGIGNPDPAQQQVFGANPNFQSNANVQKKMNIQQAPMGYESFENTIFAQQYPAGDQFPFQPQQQPLFGNDQQKAFLASPNFQSNANVQKMMNVPFMQQVPMGNKSSAMNNNLFAQKIPSIPSNNQMGSNSINYNIPLFPGVQSSKMLEEIVQKEVKSDEKEKEPIVSIIITIYAGNSYDNLFRDVQQVVVGGRITLYSLSLLEVDRFYDCLTKGKAETNNKDFNDVMNKILAELSDIEPDCVLFNFECCSSCSERNYHFVKAESTIQLIKHAIDKGHYVMCSDFAVHALINDWKENMLGPNPFIILGNCSQFIELKFNPDDLKASKSKQLQMVGDLCQKGSTSIHALGGTVVFGIQKAKADNKVYSVEILTVVTNTSGFDFKTKEENFGRIGEKKGPIGHAVLKYKSGGLLMVSSGHWIELKNLDVDIENFEKVAEMNYGKNNAYVEELRSMKNASVEEKKQKVQMFSAQFVQQTTNCNYSSKRMQKF